MRASLHRRETAILDRSFVQANNGRMQNFAGIEAFVAVVEHGSFTAAARALQTAKSSVSETVRTLEERLGVRLLERTTRLVRPTEAGSGFYRRCRRLLDEAAAARREAQALNKVPVGRLRIAVPDGFAGRYIVPGLPAFFAAWPGLEVELIAATGTVRLIDEGADLAIRIAVQPRLLVNDSESLRAAALGGLGLVAAPEWLVADGLVAGQLVRVLDSHPPPSGGLYAVYPTNRLLAPRVRVFVDHLVRDLRARGLPR